MKWGLCVIFMVVYAANSANNSTHVQRNSDECVKDTLVLGDGCEAKPPPHFLQDLKSDIESDVALIVLKLVIRDVSKVWYSQKFDLVKTDLGEFLLSLKSQMDFLTIHLPLLSDKVQRKYVELQQHPHSCLAKISINELLVKTWLLCVLTKNQGGVEQLLVKTLCTETVYEEPNEFYLFKDNYSLKCTDTPNKASDWDRLNEDPTVVIGRDLLNYGVTAIITVLMFALNIYRRLFHTKTRVFLCKLRNPLIKLCEVVGRSDVKEGDIKLYPDKRNIPPIKIRRYACTCARGKKEKRKRAKTECISNNRLEKWKNCQDKTKYQLNITGFWLDIEKDNLISYKSFGLGSFLRESIAEIFSQCCCSCEYICMMLPLTTIVGLLVAVFYLYQYDPFHTLLDGILGLVSLVIVAVSMMITNFKFGFAVTRFFLHSLFVELLFSFFAFFAIAISVRAIIIIVIGFALQAKRNIYTLVSLIVGYIFANGYYQLQKTHKRYQVFLDKCIKHIRTSMDGTIDALDEPDFQNIILPEITSGESCPGEENNKWPRTESNQLFWTLNGYRLFYLPNGEPAIDQRLFLELCESDDKNSPGDLGLAVCIDFIKLFLWGCTAICIILPLDHVARKIDHSFYSQTPTTLLGGLIPILLNYVFFPEHPPEAESKSLDKLITSEAQDLKSYPVIDFEIEGSPDAIENTEPVWQRVCIEHSNSFSISEGDIAGMINNDYGTML